MWDRQDLPLTLVLCVALAGGGATSARTPSRLLNVESPGMEPAGDVAILGQADLVGGSVGHARGLGRVQPSARRRGLGAVWTRLKDSFRDGVAVAFLSLASFRARELDPAISAEIESLQPHMKRTRFIGEKFFPLYTKEEGLEPGRPSTAVGLIPNMEELRSSDFDPAAVHPAVRDFYERTGQYQLTVTANSDALGWVIMGISNRVAKAMGNGRVPLAARAQQLNSDLMELDTNGDGEPDARTWTRTYARNREPALIGYYRSVMFREQPYVAVLFPYTVGNQISILRLTNRSDGGVKLSSHDRSDPIAGDYFCRVDDEGAMTKARPFTLISQELDVYVDPQTRQPVADHRFYGLGKARVQLRYRLTR